MNKQQQAEYDFFIRMASLAEQRMMQFAPLRDDPGPPGELFRQYVDDMENCRVWAERIKIGWTMIPPTKD